MLGLCPTFVLAPSTPMRAFHSSHQHGHAHCWHGSLSLSTVMMELDQLAEVLASVSRHKVLSVFAANDQLNANQVCRRLQLPISKVRRVRSALRRLARTGELHERVSPSFPGLRTSAPTYTVLCIPSTPLAHTDDNDDDDADGDCNKADDKRAAHKSDTMLSTPPCRPASPLPAPAPSAVPHSPVTTPHNACCVCHSTPSLVVLLPCLHQRVCDPCWKEYETREKKKHKSELRRYPHRERSRLVVRCPICREAVQDVAVPFVDL